MQQSWHQGLILLPRLLFRCMNRPSPTWPKRGLFMRKLLLAAVATVAIASPAVARDGSGYVGVDFGAMLAEDTKLDFDDGVDRINNLASVDYNTGFDIGLTGGYDFGMVRAEGELAYKRAGVNEVV